MRRVIGWLIQALREAGPTLVVLGLLLAARSSLADQYVVPSGSMEATLQVGDRIAVDKRAYGWRVPFTDVVVADGEAPRAGEVVIFDSADGVRLVKRVAAVGGDVVAIERRDGIRRRGVLPFEGITRCTPRRPAPRGGRSPGRR